MKEIASNYSKFIKKGFILPLVFGAMAVLTIFFFTMSFLSSGQTVAATHFMDSSRALCLAKSGADWAVSTYASGSYGINEDMDEICKNLFLNSKKDIELDLQYPVALLNYADSIDAKLEIKMRVYDIAPLGVPEEAEKYGFKIDPVEKSGKIEFISVATVGKSSKKVCIRKGFKVVMIVHPVLSKFTLFLRKKLAGQEVNILERKTAKFGFTNGSAIVLNNQGLNKSFKAVDPSTYKFNLSPVTDYGFAKLIQNSGWVFLNSGSTDPWTLNLSGSGIFGEFDDRLLLRLATYRQPELQNTLPSTYPHGEKLTAFWKTFQGMKTDYYCVDKDGTAKKKATNILYLKYLFPDGPPKVSVIRPFGKATQFSPTLVLGPVYMKYLVLQGMDCSTEYGSTYSNVIVPGFLNRNDFANTYQTAIGVAKDAMYYFTLFLDIKDVKVPDFEKYSSYMTKIETSPYLQALDYIFLNEKEEGTLLAPKPANAAKNYMDPPPQIFSTITNDIAPWANDRNSLFKGEGKFAMDSTQPIFEGKLANIKGCKEFQPKITAVFPSFKELLKNFQKVKEGKDLLGIPGIVYLGEKDLVIDKELEITSPGIIISGGNVYLRSEIRSNFPVTIVSLKDMYVETSSQIDAHLICLMGTFHASNGFAIKGGLAAKSIDLSNIINNPKTITFEPAHDPYSSKDKWAQKLLYRFQLSQEEEYSVEGGK